MPERSWQEIDGDSAMQRWRLPVIRYRSRSGRPGAYLQAALHADEQPGVAAIHELARLLDRAEAGGRILKDVTLVPYANPVGLHQVVDGRHLGRFHLGSGVNFNRAFHVRAAQGRGAPEAPADEAAKPPRVDEALKAALVDLAGESEVILDLHCDKEAMVYVFTHAELWPGAQDLAARLGAGAVLLWAGPEEGGAAFEEAVTIHRLPARAERPFLSATVELRGRSDVDGALARRDAQALYDLLAERGIVAEPALGSRPAWSGPVVHQDCVVNVPAPALGTLLLEAALGARVAQGQVLARILSRPGDPAGEVAVPAPVAGLLLIRALDRLARPGETIATIIADAPAPGSARGRTLSP
jgi:predicted deacylase